MNAVDVAHLKPVRGGPERLVVDEDAVDDCPDRLRSVPFDESSYRRIEMRILVLGSRVLRPLTMRSTTSSTDARSGFPVCSRTLQQGSASGISSHSVVSYVSVVAGSVSGCRGIAVSVSSRVSTLSMAANSSVTSSMSEACSTAVSSPAVVSIDATRSARVSYQPQAQQSRETSMRSSSSAARTASDSDATLGEFPPERLLEGLFGHSPSPSQRAAAREPASRAGHRTPQINGNPVGITAGAVYLASRNANQRITQATLAEAVDLSTTTIRTWFQCLKYTTLQPEEQLL